LILNYDLKHQEDVLQYTRSKIRRIEKYISLSTTKPDERNEIRTFIVERNESFAIFEHLLSKLILPFSLKHSSFGTNLADKEPSLPRFDKKTSAFGKQFLKFEEKILMSEKNVLKQKQGDPKNSIITFGQFSNVEFLLRHPFSKF
jgi:hypothetical protein